jgi:CDP-glycerol glycerophosphotransferase
VLERLSLDVDRWDLLLSPNRYSTAVLRGAFGWQGPVLETGYPRNDVLRWAGADRIRQQVRQSLGIEDGQTVVLYTPTWRDDTFWERGPDAATLALDVAGFEGLGDEYVVLVRLHYKLTGRPQLPDSKAIRNVSGHPEVAELYLAADVMVTDYSSTMFDFAVTGKPVVFYTYDLEHYRDEVRGFYFDLSTQAPGPLVRSQQQLVDSLRNLDALKHDYAAAYGRLTEKFCHLDDGHATERFLEHLVPAG